MKGYLLDWNYIVVRPHLILILTLLFKEASKSSLKLSSFLNNGCELGGDWWYFFERRRTWLANNDNKNIDADGDGIVDSQENYHTKRSKVQEKKTMFLILSIIDHLDKEARTTTWQLSLFNYCGNELKMTILISKLIYPFFLSFISQISQRM